MIDYSIWCFSYFFHFCPSNIPDSKSHIQKWCMLLFTPTIIIWCNCAHQMEETAIGRVALGRSTHYPKNDLSPHFPPLLSPKMLILSQFSFFTLSCVFSKFDNFMNDVSKFSKFLLTLKLTSLNLSYMVRKQHRLSVFVCRYSLNVYKMKLNVLFCISLFHKCKIISSNDNLVFVCKSTFGIINHSLINWFVWFLNGENFYS